MEEDRGLSRNLAYVETVTKISKAATRAFRNMYNRSPELFTKDVNKNKPLFAEKTVERYMGKGTVERYTEEAR